MIPVPERKQRPDQFLRFNDKKKNKLPIVVQSESAECGLACLAMIAGYHGFDIDMVTLRRRFGTSSRGITIKQLVDIASKLEMAPRALRLELDEIGQLQLPCIIHWGLDHFVVLKSVSKNGVIVHDPSVGERQLDLNEVDKAFTGIALELIPTPEFKAGADKKNLTISHFWSRITGLKRCFFNIVLVSLLLQVFAVTSPLYMQLVVDSAVLHGDKGLLQILALAFAILLLIQTATSYLRETIIMRMSVRLNVQMAANLFRHLIRLPLDYFSKRHMGDIVSRFGSLADVRQLLTTGFVTAFVDGFMAIITLTAMFFYNIKLTVIVLVFVTVYGLLRWTLYKPFRRLNEENLIAHASEHSHFMESVRAIQTIKLFQRENDRQTQWMNRMVNAVNKNIQIARWHINYGVLSAFLFGLENLIVVYFAASSVMANTMSIGMLFAYMAYKTRFIDSMDSFITQWVEIKIIDVHLNRLADIAFSPTEKIDLHEVNTYENQDSKNNSRVIGGKIEVKNLAYKYSEIDHPVFSNLNFVIEKGETVAITGPSGCGKTTLMKCLMGLLPTTEGEILIDGKPIDAVPHYRSQIAGVMQEDQLLSGTIADNIACFDSQVDLEKVRHCARMACVDSEIESMPMGYNSLIGDMGTSLSGGQKQRIVLARALYRQPRILFLDEATSHLDINKESVVNEHINLLLITRVIVAHRPETIKSAGREIRLA